MEDVGPVNVQGSGEDYKELLEQLNKPGALQGLLDNIEAMKQAIHSLDSHNKSLEVAIDGFETLAIGLEKQVQTLEGELETLHQSTALRTDKLEQSLYSLKQGPIGPTSDAVRRHQQLWDLMQLAPKIYTPKVLRHFLEKELMECTSPSDRLVLLARKHHKIEEIKRVYQPDSNFWLSPKPMDRRMEMQLLSLPPKEQEMKMDWYWTEILRYFKEDTCGKITLFELEDTTLQMGSHEERCTFLQEYINSGKEVAKDLSKKKSLALIKKMMGLQKS